MTIPNVPIPTYDSNGIVTFADDILIKDDGTIGSATTANAMTVEAAGQVTFVGDIGVGDDLFMQSDSAQITFGTNTEIRLQHVHNSGLTLFIQQQVMIAL